MFRYLQFSSSGLLSDGFWIVNDWLEHLSFTVLSVFSLYVDLSGVLIQMSEWTIDLHEMLSADVRYVH